VPHSSQVPKPHISTDRSRSIVCAERSCSILDMLKGAAATRPFPDESFMHQIIDAAPSKLTDAILYHPLAIWKAPTPQRSGRSSLQSAVCGAISDACAMQRQHQKVLDDQYNCKTRCSLLAEVHKHITGRPGLNRLGRRGVVITLEGKQGRFQNGAIQDIPNGRHKIVRKPGGCLNCNVAARLPRHWLPQEAAYHF
jgi:hypothetical protein